MVVINGLKTFFLQKKTLLGTSHMDKAGGLGWKSIPRIFFSFKKLTIFRVSDINKNTYFHKTRFIFLLLSFICIVYTIFLIKLKNKNT